MSRRDVSAGPVVIAVDPHKRSWTAVAVSGSLQLQTSIRVDADRDGYRELRRFAGRWPEAWWAIEGAGGLGAPLATRLLADGLAVLDVPAKLAARVRALSTGHGRKTDEADGGVGRGGGVDGDRAGVGAVRGDGVGVAGVD